MPSLTFEVAASGDDGHVRKFDSVYPPAASEDIVITGTVMSAYKAFTSPTYHLTCGLMRWDTASIPDGATITAATLRIRVDGRVNDNARDLTAEWYSWTPPITGSHWTSTVGTNAHAGTSISSLTATADNDLALLDPGANIDKTGYTGIRIHTSGGSPTGANFADIATFDHATLLAPRLIVDYEEPAILQVFQSRVPMPMMGVPDQDRIMRMHGRTLGS